MKIEEMTEPIKKILNQREAAKYIGIGVITFRNIVGQGLIPKIVLNKRALYDIKDLDTYIQGRKEKTSIINYMCSTFQPAYLHRRERLGLV